MNKSIPTKVMHEKQRIQGVEKQAMDQAFRESLKITPIKHDKDMTSEDVNKFFDDIKTCSDLNCTDCRTREVIKKKVKSLLSQQREQILNKVSEEVIGEDEDLSVHVGVSQNVGVYAGSARNVLKQQQREKLKHLT